MVLVLFRKIENVQTQAVLPALANAQSEQQYVPQHHFMIGQNSMPQELRSNNSIQNGFRTFNYGIQYGSGSTMVDDSPKNQIKEE